MIWSNCKCDATKPRIIYVSIKFDIEQWDGRLIIAMYNNDTRPLTANIRQRVCAIATVVTLDKIVPIAMITEQ